jgi:hypothetical protein
MNHTACNEPNHVITRNELYNIAFTRKDIECPYMTLLMSIYDYNTCYNTLCDTIKKLIIKSVSTEYGITKYIFTLSLPLSHEIYSENGNTLAKQMWMEIQIKINEIFPGITIITDIEQWNKITIDWS